MIKDRGNIKWSSLMLVEHREELKKLLASIDEIPKPELDEQKLEEMNLTLQQAIRENIAVSIIYYQDKKYNYYQGKIKNYNPITKKFVLARQDTEQKLMSENIIEISISTTFS